MKKNRAYNRQLKLDRCDTIGEVEEEVSRLLSYAMIKLRNLKIREAKDNPVGADLAYRRAILSIVYHLLAGVPSYVYRSIHNLSREVRMVLLDIQPIIEMQRDVAQKIKSIK